MKTHESHPREWVDFSDPAYKGGLWKFANPTNFRWWDLRTRSVLECRLELNNPP